MLSDQWVEIFRAGEYPQGKVTETDLDQVVASYRADLHEAPVVIGHPADNQPAWGWVEGMKRQGNTLLAQLKNVQPAFEEMVEKGLFKKRSASFYRNFPEKGKFYLRHVGFLGAKPPEVKALKDIFVEAHAEGEVEVLSFEFNNPITQSPNNPKEGGRKMSILDKLKGLVREAEEGGGGEPVTPPATRSFSEAEITARIDTAIGEATARLVADFEAQIKNSKTLKEAKDRAEERMSQIEQERVHEKVVSFCEALRKDGKLIPAWEKLGLVKFIEALPDAEIVEFSDEAKVSPRQWFQNFLEGLGKIVNFKELAPRGDALPEDAGEKLVVLTHAKMKAEKIEFKEAFNAVQLEYPDLALEYLMAVRPKS